MNEINNSLTCERGPDLVTFLYDEANENDRRDFELHLKQCESCAREVASFAVVRESITAWRDEALSGFVSTPLTATTRRKSAVAALRQFFELSPMWLKGATAFAVVALCVFAALAIVRPRFENNSSANVNPNAIYTAQDVERLLKEALAKQQPPVENPDTVTTSNPPKPKKVAPSSPVAKSRRPLSRSEREQLAADLRLSTPDDVNLNLLGDRINQ